MRVEKITFMQTFPTGNYSNQKLGIEIMIEPQDNLEGIYHYAKHTVEDAFKAMNPHLYTNTEGDRMDDFIAAQRGNNPNRVTDLPTIDPKKETLKEIIADCNTIEELVKIKPDCDKYCLWQEYLSRYETIENQSIKP